MRNFGYAASCLLFLLMGSPAFAGEEQPTPPPDQPKQDDDQYDNIAWICEGRCEGAEIMDFGEYIKISMPSFVKPIYEDYFTSNHYRWRSELPRPTKPEGCDYTWEDKDSDGDGFDDEQEPLDPRHLLGPYIADVPYFGTKQGEVHVSIPIIYKSTQRRSVKEELISGSSYEKETRTSRLHTIKREFGGDLEGTFGLASSGWTFSLGAKGKSSLLNTSTLTVEQSERLKISETFQDLLIQEEQELIEIDTTQPAVLQSYIELIDLTSPSRQLELTDIEVAIVSYDENSEKRYWGSRLVSSINVLPGQTNRSALLIEVVIDKSGLVYDLIQSLAKGHTFVAEVFRTPIVKDRLTGEDLTPRLIEIIQKTATLQIHYGRETPGETTPEALTFSPRISLRRLHNNYYCLTPFQMLEEWVGTGNFEVSNGIVTRIHHKQNRHSLRAFSILSEEAKDEYGKWIMSRECPMSATYPCTAGLNEVLGPDDIVTFYFLTREDYETSGDEIRFVDIDDDIGIIPERMSDCPASQRVQIRMDDEDSDNRNSRAGWIGATQSTDNTLFQLCKVDGKYFRNITKQAEPGYHSRNEAYAAVALDTYCPKDSYRFERYFDNEDSDNKNWTTGTLRATTQDKYGTRMRFCLFLPYPDTPVSPFPDLGFSYGVFGSPEFFDGRGQPRGWIYTDDEDSNNKNALKHGTLPRDIVRSIVRPEPSGCCTDGNTTLRMGKVK